jgi:hypothetical protein
MPTYSLDDPSQESKVILALACFVLQSGLFCASLRCFFSGHPGAILFGLILFLAAVAIGVMTVTDATSQLQSDSPLLQIFSSELPWWANLIYGGLTLLVCFLFFAEELTKQETFSEQHTSVLLSGRESSFRKSFPLNSKFAES